jgi:hypothetical protein
MKQISHYSMGTGNAVEMRLLGYASYMPRQGRGGAVSFMHEDDAYVYACG